MTRPDAATYRQRLDFYLGAQSPTYGRRRRDEVRLVANYTRVLVELHASATLGTLTVTHAGRPVALDAGRVNAWLRAAIVLGDAWAYVDRDGGWRILPPAAADYADPADPAAGVTVRHRPDYAETWTTTTLAVHNTTHPNPYRMVPVIHLRGWPSADPATPYGHSIIDDLAPVARLLNERLSQYLWLLRTQATPPIVTRGLDRATLRVEPGEIWPLPREASADILRLMDSGTAQIHTQAIAILQRTMRDLAGVPDIAFGIGNVALSGEAIRRAYYPLLQAIATRRILLTQAIHDLALAILTVRAVATAAPPPEPEAIAVKYADTLPI